VDTDGWADTATGFITLTPTGRKKHYVLVNENYVTIKAEE